MQTLFFFGHATFGGELRSCCAVGTKGSKSVESEGWYPNRQEKNKRIFTKILIIQ